MTHTYATLKLSPGAFKEIRDTLAAAGYEDQFHDNKYELVVDMHGIAVTTKREGYEALTK